MEKSRTEYSTMNTVVAMISRIAAILMGFVTRVVFTHTLSESYVGINGLFTDILNVLSLTELGVETAISYALYRPIAQGDIRKQQILMRMFRTFYRITAGCVVVLGLSIIPFFDVLMKNRPDVDHLMLIYFLYLANSVVSYMLVYKRTLIEVHQLNYIVLLYQTAFLILQDICQIVILFTTHNFIFFLSIYIVCTLLSNICISRKADRMYPYLKEKTKEQLPEDERKDIFRNIKAMLMHKLGNVVVNNTDNLLISSFVGVISVGIYSNYFLLIGSVRQVLDQIFQGITASVGNLGATEDEGRVKSIFETAFFIGNWHYWAAAICLYELLNPFVELAFGKHYLFDMPVVGFENHGGRTYINDNQPFGKVLYGAGNDGISGCEGVVYKNVIGTYLHGPLLPKNPQVTDYLIAKALERKYEKEIVLEPLEDEEEREANRYICQRFVKES